MTEAYGYFEHPNSSSRDGTIHEIAERQLAFWEEVAMEWYTETTDDGYMRCGQCTQAIARVKDRHGHIYALGREELLALKVAHIRQAHAELGELCSPQKSRSNSRLCY